tara:strand:+ start:230 stop:1153 length:924 start_codon:yes stop_codon:yes gene_type:complete
MSNRSNSQQNKKQTQNLEVLSRTLNAHKINQDNSIKVYSQGVDPTETIASGQTSTKGFVTVGGVDKSDSNLAKINPIKVNDAGEITLNDFEDNLPIGGSSVGGGYNVRLNGFDTSDLSLAHPIRVDEGIPTCLQTADQYGKKTLVLNTDPTENVSGSGTRKQSTLMMAVDDVGTSLSKIRPLTTDFASNLQISNNGRTHNVDTLTSESIAAGAFYTTSGDLGVVHQTSRLILRLGATGTAPTNLYLQVSMDNSTYFTATGIHFINLIGTNTDSFATTSLDDPPRYFRIFNNGSTTANFSIMIHKVKA